MYHGILYEISLVCTVKQAPSVLSSAIGSIVESIVERILLNKLRSKIVEIFKGTFGSILSSCTAKETERYIRKLLESLLWDIS